MGQEFFKGDKPITRFSEKGKFSTSIFYFFSKLKGAKLGAHVLYLPELRRKTTLIRFSEEPNSGHCNVGRITEPLNHTKPSCQKLVPFMKL